MTDLNKKRYLSHLDKINATDLGKKTVILQRIFEEKDKRCKIHGADKPFMSKPGSRAYFVAKKTELDSLAPQGNLHEVVFGDQPRCLYFDIDISLDKLDQLKLNSDFQHWIINQSLSDDNDEIADAIKDLLCNDISETLDILEAEEAAEYLTYERHREDKFSYHLITDNYYVNDYQEQNAFVSIMRIQQKQPDILYDLGVFDFKAKRIDHFALPQSFNKGYQLKSEGGYDKTARAVSVIPKKDCFAVPGLVEFVEAEYQPVIIDDEETDMIIEYFAETCPSIAENHSFRMRRDNFLNYNRVCADYCDICDRDHDHDNTLYLFVDEEEGKLMRGCIRQRGIMREVGYLPNFTGDYNEMAEIAEETEQGSDVSEGEKPDGYACIPVIEPRANNLEVETIKIPMLGKKQKPINTFYDTDDYVYKTFVKEYSSKQFDSEKTCVEELKKDLPRVLAMIMTGDTCFIKKDNVKTDMFVRIAKIDKLNDFKLQIKKPNGKYGKVKFSTFLQDNKHHFEMFTLSQSEPNHSKVDLNDFNVYSGILAKEQPIEWEKLQPLLDYINEVWCNKDEAMYTWLMKYIYFMVWKPDVKLAKAIAVLGEQGTGKSFFIEFLSEFVLGSNKSYSVPKMKIAVQKHNGFLINRRMVVINEANKCISEEQKANFDTLKDYITEPTIPIEPKFENPDKRRDYICWFLISNHDDSLFLEDSDRRFCVIKTSSCHKQDIDYFAHLDELCRNQETANMFVTYIKRYETTFKDLTKSMPKTKIRQEIINSSKENPEVFIDYFIKELENKKETLEKEIKGEVLVLQTKYVASALHANYKTWCKAGDERVLSLITCGKYWKRLIPYEEKRNRIFYEFSTLIK